MCWQVWDVSIIDTVMKDFYNKSLDTMVGALQTNLTVSTPPTISSSKYCRPLSPSCVSSNAGRELQEGWSDDVGHWENCANKKATCANE